MNLNISESTEDLNRRELKNEQRLKKILNKGVNFYYEVIESLNLRLEMVKIGFSGNNRSCLESFSISKNIVRRDAFSVGKRL